MSKPLEGIRVLDLTTFVAAPVCARLLGDLGASVIKVERPDGDGWREFGISKNARFSHDENPVFDIYNSGKRCVALDLKAPEGKEVFWKLMEQADVFVTNTRPDALRRLGFDYETVKDRCPRLIYAMVLGYGLQGPDAGKPAFDTTAFWTRSGFLRDMAPVTSDYMPVFAPYGVGDTVTGLSLMGQVCAALIGRSRTGKGDYIEACLYHTGIFTMGSMEIMDQKPWGTCHPVSREDYGAPGGCYQCADGEWVLLAGMGLNSAWNKAARMFGRPELLEDARFADGSLRREHARELYHICKEEFLKHPHKVWLEKAVEFDIPLVVMNHFSDVTTDEQAWANGYLEHMQCRSGETLVMPRSPIHMQSVGELKTTPAPRVGTHTREVLMELGYSEEELNRLKSAGIIAEDE